VTLHLETQLGMSPAEVEDLFYRKSGLLGVSGISSDMRTLADSKAPEAAEAIELFASRAAREVAALATSLGGIDALVFTAGIGENDADIRSRICRRLEWIGVRIDELANSGNGLRITMPASPVAVLVIPTDEERMIALHTLDLLGARP
jgi:acetate kinase